MGNLFSNILKNEMPEQKQGLNIEMMECKPSDIADTLKGHEAPGITTKELERIREDIKAMPVNQYTTNYDGEYEVEGTPNVIDLEDITLKFGDFTLFDKLNFSIPDFKGEGQFIAIMGGSGSGKTMISRLISGLKKPNSGTLKMYGKPYDDKTHVPMVFQQYSSFPWMTVLENVALPLKMKGVDKETREARAMEILKMVGLEGHEHKYAQYPALSGGQLQRVSLARNLAGDSQIMILDEYSSGLDTTSKATMQDILLKLFYDDKIDRTFIMITHDINEAIYLSQRVYLLDAKTHTFGDVVDIKFNGKRDRSIIGSQKYQEYYKRIENFFKN